MSTHTNKIPPHMQKYALLYKKSEDMRRKKRNKYLENWYSLFRGTVINFPEHWCKNIKGKHYSCLNCYDIICENCVYKKNNINIDNDIIEYVICIYCV